MLLRFGFANLLSINEYQELSLIADTALKDDCADLIGAENFRHKVLPVVGLYGANASGKSNIIGALELFSGFVTRSYSKSLEQKNITRRLFLLDPEANAKPTEFDCDLVVEGIRYHYGFKINDERILEEWLYAYPKSRKQVWFHRHHENSPETHFGSMLQSADKDRAKMAPANSLLLSTAAGHEKGQLYPLYSAFASALSFELSGETGVGLKDPGFVDYILAHKSRAIDLLKWADVGIDNIEMVDFSDDSVISINAVKNILGTIIYDSFADFQSKSQTEEVENEVVNQERIKKAIALRSEQLYKTHKTIQFFHQGVGKIVQFDFDKESRGTRMLFAFFPLIYTAIDKGTTLIIDEINANLHPLLARKLIALFQNNKTNPKGAQLIFTTHDTNLLSGDLLRRDQVWFTEKSRQGATSLYPLSDFKARKGENMEKGYLQGRFGAIPYLVDVENIFCSKEVE